MKPDYSQFFDHHVIFEDANLIVINKPAGLLSQGDSSGQVHLVQLLQKYLGRPYVGLIHRLDRNTSGAIVVAKRTKAAQRLTKQIQDKTLKRKYWAILAGRPPERFTWEHFLVKELSANQVRQAQCSNESGAKKAILGGQLIELLPEDRALVEIELHTGRSHQIRAQAQIEGYPLIGDPKYGVEDSKGNFSRPALHSRFIEFEHPISREKMGFDAALPGDFQKEVSGMG